ncbi:hypothetical protein G3I74_14665 [Wenzhouxiangella sp. C33]|uniref:Uncharacterized protein n=2 Tax=Wenzhouxiangella limi TaxID=2707351 RepID=A0A845VA21_9GAMM|nr:hypothetical protein [Wenzhouxiangella limi]
MTIDVAFLSAFVLKSNLEEHYPGGLTAFSDDFPRHRTDDQLVRLSAMSGGELREEVDQLISRGIPVDRISIADWTGGPWENSPGIRFHAIETDSFPPKRWRASAE